MTPSFSVDNRGLHHPDPATVIKTSGTGASTVQVAWCPEVKAEVT